MIDLTTIANLAEIAGGIAIISGGIFAVVQLREFREQRRQAVAVELVRSFSEPEHANAINLIRELPDGATAELLRSKGREYERAATMVAVTYETVGLLVFREMASFALVYELTGGLTVVMWRKLEAWVRTVRDERVARGDARLPHHRALADVQRRGLAARELVGFVADQLSAGRPQPEDR